MTATEIKSAFEDLQKTWKDHNDKVTTELEEIKKYGHALPETKTMLDRLNERLDEIETKLARAKFDEDTEQKESLNLALKAYDKFLRHPKATREHFWTSEEKGAFAEMEQKTLTVGNDLQLGVLVPEDFRAEVIKRLPNIAGLARLVRQESTARDVVRYPRLTHTTSDTAATQLGGRNDLATSAVGVVWEDELQSVTETDFSMGQINIPVYKLRSLVRIGRELLEDSAVAIVPFLTQLFAERFAIELDRVITVGSGGKQPTGFTLNASIPTVASGSGSNVPTYDGLVNTLYTLPQQYVNGARWMMRRSTLGALRKLKDGMGQPLWQPGMQMGEPSSLLGFPVDTNEFMPATGTAGAKSVIFANWNLLYLLVTKTSMQVQRLDEKYADTDEVGFICRQRFGGDVIGEWAGVFNTMS